MKNTPRMRSIYATIQNELFYMIPEKLDRVYLYASVIENINNVETGEMYFYYFPKGILKRNPINVYEVPSKFNIDEEAYNRLANKLYATIKSLRKEFEKNNEKLWSSIIISIENYKFNIEFNYENILNSKYSNEDRHLIFKYLYLGIPIESFSKKEQEIISSYLFERKFINEEKQIYTEGMYKNGTHNVIEYNQEYISENDRLNMQNKDVPSVKEEKETHLDKYEAYKRKKQKEKQMNNIETNITKEQGKTKINQILTY